MLGISILAAGSLVLFSIQKRLKSNAQAELNRLIPQYSALKKEERKNKIIIRTGDAVTTWSKESKDWLANDSTQNSVSYS